MRKILTLSRVVAVCSLGVLAVACGSDESSTPTDTTESPAAETLAPSETAAAETAPETAAPDTAAELPTIVVTTNILGDIVTQAVGDLAEVEVIMPVGSDPHDFSPSARQAESMENADLLVVNGAGFEEGMVDIIEQVESSGTRVFEFADHIELLEFDGDDHSDDDHSDDDDDTPTTTTPTTSTPTKTSTPTTTTPTTTTPTTTPTTRSTTTVAATRTSGPTPRA
jgi:zinc/manganese transport system substrate-binding protein